ncbi:BglG family transcription antiterminator [Halobacillus litoralis]|uniref:BglG family transcription antiterminator n=1 Tax=Halobacillus litoralis TaxID=45668 RepID=UPI001CFF4286|nr:PRD domain-containing protein [Halobacillus litoralis]
MFITSKEKAIIELIVRTSGKHTVYSLSVALNVSGRTIQRNLKSIENILKEFQLELKRTTDEGLFIDGTNQSIYKLIQGLAAVNTTDETPEERKLRLLILLFEEGPSFKKQVLAKQLGVSIATMNTHLEDLEEWLRKFSITLTKKRGVGLEVSASESNKRKALASFLLVYFYEDIMEQLYLLKEENHHQESVLGYFHPDYLVSADEVVSEQFSNERMKVVDIDYLGLIVHLCITMQRSDTGHLLEEYTPIEKGYLVERELMRNITGVLKQRLRVDMTDQDIDYMTIVLKGSKVQHDTGMYYDKILLGHIIRDVIRDVSSNLHVDLTNDFSLYQGLLAHMGTSVFRLQQEMGLYNPLKEEIQKKYPVLFMAVKKSLESYFKDIAFPDDEIAFIVLHFGSALLAKEENSNIQAVVVCPTGIGASKMLASRIQKELPMIQKVEILSINDFQTADLDKYDLIISTVRLPFSGVEYIMTSPLLNEEDIGFIQNYLQNNLEKLTAKKQWRPLEKERSNSSKPTKVRVLLKEIKEVHTSMEAILQNFRVYRKRSVMSHWDVIGEMVQEAEEEKLLVQADKVFHHLKERERMGGLGIPGTNMGLFHCRDESVKQLVFQVAHLDNPSSVKGMDGEEVKMKSLLLMIAPEDLSSRQQEILSIISTGLIDSQESMMIFSSSNKVIIQEKLEELFLDYLQKKLIKE